MNRFLNNPFIGEKWLPLAEVLMELHRVKINNEVTLHTLSTLYPKIDKKKRGPRIRIRYMDTGEILFSASANDNLGRKLKAVHYQSMEFLGFNVPRTAEGEYALEYDSCSRDTYENFIRVFDESTDPEELVELSILLFVLIYKLPRVTQFFFGSSQGQHIFVHGLNKIARLASWKGNEKASVFMFNDLVRSRALFENELGSIDAN
jgi:hypothetical protein